MSSSKAMDATYSYDEKELNIPMVIDKGSNKPYRVFFIIRISCIHCFRATHEYKK
jgi:protein-disulfide isomerase